MYLHNKDEDTASACDTYIMRFAPLIALFVLVPTFAVAACNSRPDTCPAGQQLFYEPSSVECPNGNFSCKRTTPSAPHVPAQPTAPIPVAPRPVAPTPLPAVASSAASGGTSLSVGSRGVEVSSLQLRLIALGHLAAGNDTGYFGPLTRTAVRAFQRARDIVSSGDETSTGYGLVGPRTKAALGEEGIVTGPNQALVTELMQEVIRLTGLLNTLLAARQANAVPPQSISSVAPPPVQISPALVPPPTLTTIPPVVMFTTTSTPPIVTKTSTPTLPSLSAAELRDQQRIRDLTELRDAFSAYYRDNGGYPGDPTTYYWTSDNFVAGSSCATNELTKYLSSICTLRDPQGKAYAYAKSADGRYALAAAFETPTKQTMPFSYGSGTTRTGYFDANLSISPPTCLSPSADFQATAQRWLTHGNDVCLTAGDFYLEGLTTPDPDGLVIDGTTVSKNDLAITGAGASATRIHYNGCGAAFDLRGTIRNLDIGGFAVVGSVTGYRTDGDIPWQCSQQMGIRSDVGASYITNARIHDLAISNMRKGIAFYGGCSDQTRSGGSCSCTGPSCHANNIIENNAINNIFGMRYIYRTTTDQADAQSHHCSAHPGTQYYDCWTDESTGSGITSNNQTNLTIRNNSIDGVSRTSIYISGDSSGNSYRIDGNTIRNHRNTGLGLVTADTRSSAIAIAHTSNVTVSNNTIVNSHAVGISVEGESNLDSSNVYVTDNRFLGGAAPDIWITALGPVYVYRNNNEAGSADCKSGDVASAPCTQPNIHFSLSNTSLNLASVLTAIESALSTLLGLLGR